MDIEKVAQDRYRLRDGRSQVMTVSSQDLRDIADWCLLHMLEIEAEALIADAIARNQAMELAPNEIEAEKPETAYLDDPTRVEPGWLGDEAEQASSYNADMDARDHIMQQSVEKPWLPLHDGE